ncbi:UNVERIFIED_CONTAM: hypothetical protein Sradi_4148000 [Sesamum radiatum]|uniref:Uncharacterized protein n=1 Tax=Sesamum radiatum TaxID=300843 RepID=A0AAW2P4Q7_SESRA
MLAKQGWRIIKAGLRWKIGDKQHVRVLSDPWLPRPHTYLPITPKRMFLQDIHVSDLLDSSKEGWNDELIDFLFFLEDANLIKSIQIGWFPLSDSRFWHYDRRGIFSVKSAYHVALNNLSDASRNGVEHSGRDEQKLVVYLESKSPTRS